MLFFIELSTRKIEIGGIGHAPNGLWMTQNGRNLTDAVDGILKPTEESQPECVRRAFRRSIKGFYFDKIVLFGERSLRAAVHEFMTHYHKERNHQGLGNRLVVPELEDPATQGRVQRRERLGGLLNYYYRAAA